MRWRFTFIALPVVLLFSNCGSTTKTYELNLSEYPELPSAPLTHAARHVVEHSDYLNKRVIWGNYGGPGCSGGEPIDTMDAFFLQHDLAYLQGVRRDQLIEADRVLVSQLRSLDPAQLSWEANAYRLRAILFFTRPVSRVIGKPPDVIFGVKKQPAVIDTSSQAEEESGK